VWFAGNPTDYSSSTVKFCNDTKDKYYRNILFLENGTIYAGKNPLVQCWNASDEQKEKAANSLPSDLYNAINKSNSDTNRSSE
jgi:hypothetical protein